LRANREFARKSSNLRRAICEQICAQIANLRFARKLAKITDLRANWPKYHDFDNQNSVIYTKRQEER
jgi:hypothetical protein